MSHKEQLDFVEMVKGIYPDAFKLKKVLELGSYNINGTVRRFFDDCDYHGIDLIPGPCVDQVADARRVEYQSELFDVVISCEAFEHIKCWELAFINGYRMLKQGGLLILTAAGPARAEHGTENAQPESNPAYKYDPNYYGNISSQEMHAFKLHLLFEDWYAGQAREDQDLYFFGVKRQFKGGA